MMSGYTDKMIGIAFFHVHYFRGVTSHNGHNHYYSGITSRPIKTKNGHIHKISGRSEGYDRHQHKYLNYTYEDVEYLSDGAIDGAYV
jgi:hypothetical protein